MAEKVEVAVGKRIKIDKTKQQIMLLVLGTSLVFGICLVFSVFFIKYINFNTKVIAAKDDSIAGYNSVVKNVGICIDRNGDGKYTTDELNQCDPNSISIEEIPGTLRYNVLMDMANNVNLESVGRDVLDSCYDSKGKKRDFMTSYEAAETDEEREYQLEMLSMCSSLRAIPDALPADENVEALLSSLNLVFNRSGFEPEGIAPSSSTDEAPVEGVGSIPVGLAIQANTAETMAVLMNIERSIRAFQVQNAVVNWGGTDEFGNATLELNATTLSYYAKQKAIVESSETIYASKEARKASSN
jgi:hypothetical protein